MGGPGRAVSGHWRQTLKTRRCKEAFVELLLNVMCLLYYRDFLKDCLYMKLQMKAKVVSLHLVIRCCLPMFDINYQALAPYLSGVTLVIQCPAQMVTHERGH